MVKALRRKSFAFSHICKNTLLGCGIRYAGSSNTKGTGSPWNMVDFNNKAERIATKIPIRYTLIKIRAV